MGCGHSLPSCGRVVRTGVSPEGSLTHVCLHGARVTRGDTPMSQWSPRQVVHREGSLRHGSEKSECPVQSLSRWQWPQAERRAPVSARRLQWRGGPAGPPARPAAQPSSRRGGVGALSSCCPQGVQVPLMSVTRWSPHPGAHTCGLGRLGPCQGVPITSVLTQRCLARPAVAPRWVVTGGRKVRSAPAPYGT